MQNALSVTLAEHRQQMWQSHRDMFSAINRIHQLSSSPDGQDGGSGSGDGSGDDVLHAGGETTHVA